MGNIGDPITSGSIPAVGTSGTTYASQINLFLTEVKNRLEAAVPKTSLDAGPLDLDGDALQNASYLGLSDAGATPSTPNSSLQMHDGELYWVSASGVVKITNSGTLNASSIGGITGDYGSPNPAEFRFVDVDQEFYAYDDYGSGTWAYLGALGLDLFKNTTSTTHVRVKAASTTGSTYNLTLPPAAPGSTSTLRMDSSGNVTTDAALTYELTPDVVTWLPFDAGGYIASEAGTTGDGIWQLNGATTDGSSPIYWKCTGTTNGSQHALIAPVHLPTNAIITAGTVYWKKASNASSTLIARFYKRDITNGNMTIIASASEAGNAVGDTSKAFASGLPFTVTTGYSYMVYFYLATDPNVSGDRLYGFKLTYTL